MALPSSRVSPMPTCPALRPRWCPRLLPSRAWDYCLPLETIGSRLLTVLRVILMSTTIIISGLNHAACMLVPSSSVLPLLGLHVEVSTDLLARR